MNLALAIFAAILPMRDGSSSADQIRAEDITYISRAINDRREAIGQNTNAVIRNAVEIRWPQLASLNTSIMNLCPQYIDPEIPDSISGDPESHEIVFPENVYPTSTVSNAYHLVGLASSVYTNKASLIALDDIRRAFYDLKSMSVGLVHRVADSNTLIVVEGKNFDGDTLIKSNRTVSGYIDYKWNYGVYRADDSNPPKYTLERTKVATEKITSSNVTFDLSQTSTNISQAVCIMDYYVGYSKSEFVDDTHDSLKPGVDRGFHIYVPVVLEAAGGGFFRVPSAAFSQEMGPRLRRKAGLPVEPDELSDTVESSEVICRLMGPVGQICWRDFPGTDLRSIEWDWSPGQ